MTIHVHNLQKTYSITLPGTTFRESLRGLIAPKRRDVSAVVDVSFDISAGERVAFIGPNGAGKSTTIKILSGILSPEKGDVTVCGHVPWKERSILAYKIGTVFGQRSQLRLNLSARDSFQLLARIYRTDPASYQGRLDRLTEAFDLGRLIEKPVRTLSLGERMRCEIAASLLHAPQVLFLDEPTIGLDVTAKAAIRELIRNLSRELGVTLVFTSHDTVDIEKVCDRVIVINHGSLVLDQPLATLRRDFLRTKRVTISGDLYSTEEQRGAFSRDGVVTEAADDHQIVFRVDLGRTSVSELVSALTRTFEIQDLTVEDPPMEEVIHAIYRRGANENSV